METQESSRFGRLEKEETSYKYKKEKGIPTPQSALHFTPKNNRGSSGSATRVFEIGRFSESRTNCYVVPMFKGSTLKYTAKQGESRRELHMKGKDGKIYTFSISWANQDRKLQ